jgi:hypothetical protein
MPWEDPFNLGWPGRPALPAPGVGGPAAPAGCSQRAVALALAQAFTSAGSKLATATRLAMP